MASSVISVLVRRPSFWFFIVGSVGVLAFIIVRGPPPRFDEPPTYFELDAGSRSP